jgi:hypothetical protein
MSKFNFDKKWVRFLTGFVLVISLLSVAIAVLPNWIHTYGATPEEITSVYFGDEILPNPVITWTHAVTIAAAPDKVWPWIAQIGQSRGGYYSYTFIENLIAQDGSYRNASKIIPEYQNPKPGEMIIADLLPIRDVKSGEYFLAATEDFFGVGWTWGWYLKPLGIDSTRLIIRMKIQTPGEDMNPAATWFLDAGGFVMEKAMLRGIQERAEGRSFNSPIEPLEISLWLLTLVIGIIAGWHYLNKEKWHMPLAIAMVSVVSLIIFTFIQPPVLLRAGAVLGMAIALWQVIKKGKNPTKKQQILSNR